jgi:hypothetical protein
MVGLSRTSNSVSLGFGMLHRDGGRQDTDMRLDGRNIRKTLYLDAGIGSGVAATSCSYAAIAMARLAVAAETVGEALFAIAGADLSLAAAPQLVVGKALSELLLAAVVGVPLARYHLCAWWWRCCYPWLCSCS